MIDHVAVEIGSELYVATPDSLGKEPSLLHLGFSLLVELASTAKFVHVSAGVALADISLSEEQKQEAAKVLKSLQNSHPEQSDLLDPALRSLES